MELNKQFLDNLLVDKPSLMRKGILSILTVKKGSDEIKKEPIYYIELIEDNSKLSFVTVYGVEPNSKPPTKAYEKVVSKRSFSPSTTLGKLANKKIANDKGVTSIREKPPLFMAPVMEGVDTITGIRGLGFYEREPDTISVTAFSSAKVTEGKATGVFISLDSVKWQDSVITTEDILHKFNINKQIWFNLEE